ncbi:MAG: prolyl oligopeptidase family serine peptidase [Lentisphaeria bacterium]|nr:prolyl oligopeptidase family serine peptidase [Lentisphaeria bacterium]
MMLKHTFANLLAALIPVIAFAAASTGQAGDSVRPGLENVEYSLGPDAEMALVEAIGQPLLEGYDVEAALQAWFDGRLLHSQGKNDAATDAWKAGLGQLQGLKRLPETTWGDIPEATFKVITELKLSSYPKVRIQVVEWTVSSLKQYGLVLAPAHPAPGAAYPLILYTHGAAFGIPNSFCGWLAELVNQGYVVVAPAMRGEPLFQMQFPINGREITCEGEIENLDGEVDDCLSMLNAAWKLPYVRPDEFAMVGHSFGAGVGLLAAARAGRRAKAVVSYDAWLVNPQRYYWDRMRRGANNWLSWADFCNQPAADQLRGLMTRSIVHNARHLQCPLLLFMGGAYDGSVFHLSHDDLRRELDRLNKTYSYVLVPDGDHNFVLREGSPPALFALRQQHEFLQRHYPPFTPKGGEAGAEAETVAKTDAEAKDGDQGEAREDKP